jgi:hypothetical protein
MLETVACIEQDTSICGLDKNTDGIASSGVVPAIGAKKYDLYSGYIFFV